MGEVVNVKPGFARNYLLPQKKALRASDANRQVFAERRVQLEAENLERRSEAQKIAGKLDGLSVVLVRAARSEERTSELQSLMRISYAVFCLKKKKQNKHELQYSDMQNDNRAQRLK